VGVRVCVLVAVRLGVIVNVDVAPDMGIKIWANILVGTLVAEAVGVKKRWANASRVCILSILTVAVGEILTIGKSSG